MLVTIHQPEHMPWLGFFHKIAQADILVILDSVQFSKNYFHNRNKVRTSSGWTWLTVPVNRTIETLIKDVAISADPRWKKKWQDTIFYNYKKAPFFDRYFESFRGLIDEEWKKLSDLNISFVYLLSDLLNIKTKFVKASGMDVTGKGSDRILALCRNLGAKRYLSGISGRDYLNLDDFRREGIRVEFQKFHHPIYRQLHEPFLPSMSVVDLLFNHGNKSLDIINGIGVPVLEEVFN
jgi:hypothetical protein